MSYLLECLAHKRVSCVLWLGTIIVVELRVTAILGKPTTYLGK